MAPKLVLWGASGHALVVADAVRKSGSHEVVGFIDDTAPARQGEPFAGATVLGGREVLAELLARGASQLLVAVGDCVPRLRLAEVATRAGFTLARVVHPAASVALDAVVGPGTFLAAGAVVASGAILGSCVIVNTGASVDHQCEIGDGVHVGPGARLGGLVKVGRTAWIGIGASIVDRVTIGANSVIGAGSVVTRSIPDGVVAYGVPARVVRAAD